MTSPLTTQMNGGDESTPLSPTRAPPRGVLTFAFLGPKCYAASSYPHPIPHGDFTETTTEETRDMALSANVPSSLFECIENLVALKKPAANPSSVYYFTLKPGCYIMHIFCWRPELQSIASNQPSVRFDNDQEALWLVYSWARAASAKWQTDRDPSDIVETAEGSRRLHPKLGAYVKDMRDNALNGGNISHVALGQTSDVFFIRQSDNLRNWHYRFAGLPPECELAIQKSMTASKLYKSRECPQGLHHLTFGRLRAVTLGQYGGWILYREESNVSQHANALWGGYLTDELLKALETGREKKLTVNQAVLNPHHALEYILAFNDGSVYYSFHHSFRSDFERIARQWAAAKGVKFEGTFIPLEDGDYPAPSPPPEVLEQLRRPSVQTQRASSGTAVNTYPRPHYNDRPVPRHVRVTSDDSHVGAPNHTKPREPCRCHQCNQFIGRVQEHYSELDVVDPRAPHMLLSDEDNLPRRQPSARRDREREESYKYEAEQSGKRKERRSVFGKLFHKDDKPSTS